MCGALALLLATAVGRGAGADNVFTNTSLLRLRVTIPTEGVESLRREPREDVAATVQEGTNTWTNVATRVKGTVGSLRSIDAKASLTLTFDKFVPGQSFHGLTRVHLNNSVEDPSYMHELIGNELFRTAGVPAPRVTHAIVEFNGKPAALYVFKEGFTREFLSRHFRNPDGNLYDVDRNAHDVDEPLHKSFGKGPDDRSDLDALVGAAQEPNLEVRWQQLQRTLDADQFLTFMAMEVLLGHRDGYCQARNNFRVYQNVDSNRFVFLPHGMDILFGYARAPVFARMNGLVARSIMELPEARRWHGARCSSLLTNVLRMDHVSKLIDDTLPRLKAATPADAASLDQQAADLKQRVAARIADVQKQLLQGPLELLSFQNDVATLGDWQPTLVPEGGAMTESMLNGKRALMIKAGPATSASWRARVLLGPGRYRFEGNVRSENVAALKSGRSHGAVLRVLPASGTRAASLMASQPWKKIEVPFEVKEREQEIFLMCELRASKGTAWFDAESLKLVRLP